MAWVAGRYAARSVRRNIRRTVLAIAGIAIGCILALVMEGVNRGRDEMFARAGAYSGAGHLRIVPPGWRESREPTLRLADGDRRTWPPPARNPAVIAVTPRTRAQALLAIGTRVTGVELVGVDPATRAGRPTGWCAPSTRAAISRRTSTGAIVMGAAIARRLGADLDDDILASVVGPDGDIDNAMFRIVGIVRTGSDVADRDDLPGRARGHASAHAAGPASAKWRSRSPTGGSRRPYATPSPLHVAAGDDVMTWAELNPDFKGHLKQDELTARFVSCIILFIVLLGVTSAQLAAVLERRREFAVLSALGMSSWTMVRLVLLEAGALGVFGGAAGVGSGRTDRVAALHHGHRFSRLHGRADTRSAARSSNPSSSWISAGGFCRTCWRSRSAPRCWRRSTRRRLPRAPIRRSRLRVAQ